MSVIETPGNNCDQSFEQIVNLYQEVLLRVCYTYLGDEEQAKDVVQDTFLKAYKARSSFRGECSEKTWLIQIALNTCRSIWRSAWYRHVDRNITPDQIPGIFYMDSDDDLEIMCEIMKLSPKLKEVIVLYYWKDMNISEIAKTLGLSRSTVSNRLKCARDKLRILMKRE